MRPVLLSVLVIALALPTARTSAQPSVPQPGKACLVPSVLISNQRDRYETAQNRYALLAGKAQAGLFDVRLCAPGWRCPDAAEMLKERDTILAAAQMEAATLEVTNAEPAASFEVGMELVKNITGPLKGFKELTEIDKAAKESIKENMERVEEMREELRTQASTSRAALNKARSEFESTRRELELIDAEIQKDASTAAGFRNRQQALKPIFDSRQKVLFDVQDKHHNNSIAVVDANRMAESYRRGDRLFGTFTPSKLRVLLAVAKTDEAKKFTGAAEIFDALLAFPLYRAVEYRRGTEDSVAALIRSYKVVRANRKLGKFNIQTESKLLPAILSAQMKQQANLSRAKTYETLLSGIQGGMEKAKDLKEYYDKFKEAQEAMAEIVKAREAQPENIPLRIRDAISYFQVVAAALRGVAGDSQLAEGIAKHLDLMAETPQAFTRLLNSALQGGRLQGAEFQALQDTVANAPGLRGLRAFIPENEEGMVIVPSGNRSVESKIKREEFDRVLMALSTYTSLAGKNPTQEILSALVTGTPIAIARPNSNSVVFTTETWTVDRLADRGERGLIDDNVGSVMRFINAVNAAGLQQADKTAETFAYSDLAVDTTASDIKRADRTTALTKRNRLNELKKHHDELDEIFTKLYALPLPQNIYTSILLNTGTGPRTAQNVSPLEKLLLAKRNDAINFQTDEVDWLEARQMSESRVVGTAGMRISGVPPGQQMCLTAYLQYPDGSKTPMNVQTSLAGDYTLAAALEATAIDWKRAGGDPSVTVGLDLAYAGGSQSSKLPIRLDPPALFDSMVVPETAYAGQEIELQFVANSSELAKVNPTFTVTVKSDATGANLPLTPEVVEENGVAYLVKAKFRAGRTMKEGQTIAVEAKLNASGFESTMKGSIRILGDPIVTPEKKDAPVTGSLNGCDAKAIGDFMEKLVPSLPFYSQSALAKQGGRDLRTMDRGGFGGEVPGAIAVEGLITVGVNWSLSCSTGEAKKIDVASCPAGKDATDAGVGQSSCMVSSMTRGTLDVNSYADPYQAGATVSAVQGPLSVSSTVSFGAFTPASHGARNKPEVMNQMKKASEDYAKVVAMKLLGATAALPANPGRDLVSNMLPTIIRDSPGSEAARAAAQKRDLPGAAQALNQAAQAAPNDANIQYNLSWTNQALDNTATATQAAKNYLRLAPNAADRSETEARIQQMEADLAKNPRTVVNREGCADLVTWAQGENTKVRQGKDNTRRAAILEVVVAAQRGDCAATQRLTNTYKQRYP